MGKTAMTMPRRPSAPSLPRAAVTALALALVMAAPPSASAGADDLVIVSDAAFCEELTDDVAGCVAALERLAAEDTVPMSLSALLGLSVPGPTPEPGRTTDPAWSLFLEHVTAENTAIARLLDAAASAADDFDLDRLEAVLGRIVERARAEIAWLDSQPPSPCYESAHTEWRTTMVGLRAAARTTLRGVRDRDPGQMQNGVQGLARYALEVPRDVDRLQRGESDVSC